MAVHEYNGQIEQMETLRLIPYENNAKLHNEEQIKKIAASIVDYGFSPPIEVTPEGLIIKGHGRYLAAKLLKLNSCPVLVRHDLTPSQVIAARIADNVTAQGGLDDFKLHLDIKILDEMNYDLLKTGFNIEQLNELHNKINVNMNPEQKEYDENTGKDVKMIKCPACEHEFPK